MCPIINLLSIKKTPPTFLSIFLYVGLDESMFKQYQGSATMYALDEYNEQTMKFDYEGLLPVSLGNIDYNYRTADNIDTTFEFSFSKLTPILL